MLKITKFKLKIRIKKRTKFKKISKILNKILRIKFIFFKTHLRKINQISIFQILLNKITFFKFHKIKKAVIK